VKFKDADLIGIPLRLTLGERSLKEGGLEFKRRFEADRTIVPLDGIVAFIQSEIDAQFLAIEDKVIEVPYDG